jgi:hypothetical protein
LRRRRTTKNDRRMMCKSPDLSRNANHHSALPLLRHTIRWHLAPRERKLHKRRVLSVRVKEELLTLHLFLAPSTWRVWWWHRIGFYVNWLWCCCLFGALDCWWVWLHVSDGVATLGWQVFDDVM